MHILQAGISNCLMKFHRVPTNVQKRRNKICVMGIQVYMYVCSESVCGGGGGGEKRERGTDRQIDGQTGGQTETETDMGGGGGERERERERENNSPCMSWFSRKF